MLQDKYQQEIIPAMLKSTGRKNPLSLPQVKKVVLNYRIPEARENKEALVQAEQELTAIAGQKPRLCQARLSIASFKVRQGDPLALKVTLRGRRMYHFLERFFNLVLPRVRDFRGLPDTSFDEGGNYTALKKLEVYRLPLPLLLLQKKRRKCYYRPWVFLFKKTKPRKKENKYGRYCKNCQRKKKIKISRAPPQSLHSLWPPSWVYSFFWALPALFPPPCSPGNYPWS